MQYRILVVEDEEHILEAIKLNLELENYQVSTAINGVQALKIAAEERFNLIILDIMMPKMDGLDVAQTLRIGNNDTPILFLSARNTPEDRIKGLKIGGNDYLGKPFNLEELLLRVQNLIKNSIKGTEQEKDWHEYEFEQNHINFKTFEISTPKGKFTLTKKEIMLLKLLIEKENEVVSREEILEKVWGYNVFPSTRTIDNFMLSFRKYFEEDTRNPRFFHAIRGVGYKFTL